MCVLSINVPIRKKSGNLFNNPSIAGNSIIIEHRCTSNSAISAYGTPEWIRPYFHMTQVWKFESRSRQLCVRDSTTVAHGTTQGIRFHLHTARPLELWFCSTHQRNCVMTFTFIVTSFCVLSLFCLFCFRVYQPHWSFNAESS